MMSEAKKKANRKYNEKAYAESIGKSLNGYINDLIVTEMERNGVELRNSRTDAEPTDE